MTDELAEMKEELARLREQIAPKPTIEQTLSQIPARPGEREAAAAHVRSVTAGQDRAAAAARIREELAPEFVPKIRAAETPEEAQKVIAAADAAMAARLREEGF